MCQIDTWNLVKRYGFASGNKNFILIVDSQWLLTAEWLFTVDDRKLTWVFVSLWTPLILSSHTNRVFLNEQILWLNSGFTPNSVLYLEAETKKTTMHLQLVIYSLVFSVFFINFVICFEPITMGAIGAVVSKKCSEANDIIPVETRISVY